MADYYPIIEVQAEWVLEPETLGGKQKFWYRQPGDDEPLWLFKYPRPDTGEHWAEKIAAEIAVHLEIPCARVELAIFQGARGSSAESFINDDQDLFHGNQILARHLGDYDPDQKFDQSGHTLKNIWLAFEQIFENPDGSDSAKARFAEFIVLDAIIGNRDRHHENWGVARRHTEAGLVGYLAESFDHASSLGRELQDIRRDGLLANNRVSNYSERDGGGIYWSESDKNGPSPLELARLAYGEYPEILGVALAKVSRLDQEKLEDIFKGIRGEWMSQSARRFASQLINYNCKELKGLV